MGAVEIAVIVPAAQSPTGVVMSDRRRHDLLALADEHQVPIIEDDYDSELRYEGAPQALARIQPIRDTWNPNSRSRPARRR